MFRGHNTFHVFKDNDGVVNHDADGQHQAEQGQSIDGVTESEHARERTHNGHGHGDARNQCGSPVLQEEEDDQEDQDHGFHEGMHHFVDGSADEVVRVNRDEQFHAFGKVLLQLVQFGEHAVARGDGVCAGQKPGTAGHGTHVVIPAVNGIVLTAQFHAGYILDENPRGIFTGFDDNVLEVLHFGQTPLGVELPGEERSLRRGGIAETSGRELRVLLLNGRSHIRDGDAELCHLVRVEPDTHRVVVAAEELGKTDAFHAFQLIDDVYRSVVVHVHVIVTPVWGYHGKEEQEGR